MKSNKKAISFILALLLMVGFMPTGIPGGAEEIYAISVYPPSINESAGYTSNGAVDVIDPTIAWTSTTGASFYRVLVCDNNSFDLNAYDTTTAALFMQLTGLASYTTYYWKVAAQLSSSTTTSSAYSFTTLDTDEILTCSDGDTSFTIGNTDGVFVDTGIEVKDGDDSVAGAKVMITTGFNAATDQLTFTSTAGIDGTYDSDKGALTLSGTGSAIDYQAVLRGVKFKSTTTSPGSVTISISIGGDMLYNPTNGHTYEYVLADNGDEGITWTDAKVAAHERTFYGQTGYLATISSQEENDFIKDKLAGNGWIGASDQTSEGAWKWDVETGTTESGLTFYTGGASVAGIYSNWAGGEPNNSGNEDYAYMYNTDDSGDPGTWNDYPDDIWYASEGEQDGVAGYITEYNTVTGAADSKIINITAASTHHHSTLVVPEVKNLLRFNIGNIDSYLTWGSAIEELKLMDVAPLIFEDRTLLPIRFVVEPLGGKITWNQAEKKVTITRGDTVIELWIGKNTAKINGVDTIIDPNNLSVMPIIVKPGRTMLPLRFISEALGCTVDWDQAKKEIIVSGW